MADRTMQDSLREALAMDVDDFVAAMDGGGTVQDRLAVAMCAEAMGGNVRAAQFIRDALGGFPERPKVEVRVTPFDKIAEKYAGGAERKPGAMAARSA